MSKTHCHHTVPTKLAVTLKNCHYKPKAPHTHPAPYQPMQLPLVTKARKGDTATTTPYFELSSSGKLSNPYPHLTHNNPITYLLDVLQQSVFSLKHTNPLSRNHRSCNNFNQTHISFNLLYKARLHAHEGGGDEITTLRTYQNTSNLCTSQMSSRGKAVHEAIMRSPSDTNMEDTEDTTMLETNPTKRTQDTKRGSSSSKRKKNAELIT